MNQWIHSCCPSFTCPPSPVPTSPTHPASRVSPCPWFICRHHLLPLPPFLLVSFFWFRLDFMSTKSLLYFFLLTCDMLTAAQTSISCTCFFFHRFDFLAISKPCVPFFRPTKTATHFSPLSCSCSAHAHMSPDVGRRRLPAGIFLSLQTTSFFPRPPFAFLYLLEQKSPTTTFLIKFLRCFFPSATYFFLLASSWVEGCFWPFYFVILQGLGKSSRQVRFCRAARERVRCSRSVNESDIFFPWVMWHHTADPIGGFLWVSSVALHKLWQWLVLSCWRKPFWILTSNTNAFYFSAKGCRKVVSCANTHFFLFFGKSYACDRGLCVGNANSPNRFFCTVRAADFFGSAAEWFFIGHRFGMNEQTNECDKFYYPNLFFPFMLLLYTVNLFSLSHMLHYCSLHSSP